MSQKFNKFETLCEKAFTHFSNGGFRTNTPVRLTPAFFKSSFYKERYQKDGVFDQWIKGILEANPDTFFFIHDIASIGTNASSKDANDLAGGSNILLTLKTDPRTLQWPTEFNEFTVPGNYEYVEVLNFGNNLPPVQGVPNKYERPIGDTKAKELKNDFDILGNRPIDDSLPKKNTSIPASPAKQKRYA
jgi:hypothetical protein